MTEKQKKRANLEEAYTTARIEIELFNDEILERHEKIEASGGTPDALSDSERKKYDKLIYAEEAAEEALLEIYPYIEEEEKKALLKRYPDMKKFHEIPTEKFEDYLDELNDFAMQDVREIQWNNTHNQG